MKLGENINKHVPNYFTDVVIVTFANNTIISLGVRGKCKIRELNLDSYMFRMFRGKLL